jgi:hypothetical protein
MNTYQESRNLAISMLREGSSQAEVWQALVAGGMDGGTAEMLVRDLAELQRQTQAAASQPHNVYAPPVAVYAPPVAQSVGWDMPDQGSLWKGLCLGLICGCWALLVVPFLSNQTMGSETKKGFYIGLFFNFMFGFIYAILQKH